jgi:hypothetical protein
MKLHFPKFKDLTLSKEKENAQNKTHMQKTDYETCEVKGRKDVEENWRGGSAGRHKWRGLVA